MTSVQCQYHAKTMSSTNHIMANNQSRTSQRSGKVAKSPGFLSSAERSHSHCVLFAGFLKLRKD